MQNGFEMRTAFIKTLCILLITVNVSLSAQDKVDYISESNGCISLMVTSYGKKLNIAIENAETAAIKQILFIGIPDSRILKSPLITTSKEDIIDDRYDYFEKLFKDKRYKSFIKSSSVVSKYTKDITRKKCITIETCINIKAIRQDLENHQIIRKFGL